MRVEVGWGVCGLSLCAPHLVCKENNRRELCFLKRTRLKGLSQVLRGLGGWKRHRDTWDTCQSTTLDRTFRTPDKLSIHNLWLNIQVTGIGLHLWKHLDRLSFIQVWLGIQVAVSVSSRYLKDYSLVNEWISFVCSHTKCSIKRSERLLGTIKRALALVSIYTHLGGGIFFGWLKIDGLESPSPCFLLSLLILHCNGHLLLNTSPP